MDHLSNLNAMENIRPEWLEGGRDREKALSIRNIRNAEAFTSRHGARELPQLSVGDFVTIQNQCGNAGSVVVSSER